MCIKEENLCQFKIDGKRLSQMIMQGANNLTNNVQLC